MTSKPEIVAFGIFEAPIDAIRKRTASHLDRLKIDYRVEEGANDWPVFYAEHGRQYDILRVRCFLFPLTTSRTTYVCNLADGWHSLFWNVAREGMNGVWFRSTLSDSVPYGVHEMEVWRDGVVVRHIRTLQEERGWEFLNTGTALPFERTEDFSRRRIRDRFNLEHVRLYCRSFGADLDEAYRHAGPGMLLIRT